jgi:hypothetical protein
MLTQENGLGTYCSILGYAVGFASTSITTVPACGVITRYRFASQILALVVTANFGYGDGASEQPAKGCGDE